MIYDCWLISVVRDDLRDAAQDALPPDTASYTVPLEPAGALALAVALSPVALPGEQWWGTWGQSRWAGAEGFLGLAQSVCGPGVVTRDGQGRPIYYEGVGGACAWWDRLSPVDGNSARCRSVLTERWGLDVADEPQGGA